MGHPIKKYLEKFESGDDFYEEELYELVRKYDGFKIRNIMTWIMYTTTPLYGDEYQQFYLVEGVKLEGTYLIITYDNLIDDVINCVMAHQKKYLGHYSNIIRIQEKLLIIFKQKK